jgi:hypothetical protein
MLSYYKVLTSFRLHIHVVSIHRATRANMWLEGIMMLVSLN